MGHSEPDNAQPPTASVLEDPWPGFLDLLDSNPQAAWEAFYLFAWRLVQLRCPAVFRALPEAEREDLFADLVQDLQARDFRLLRTYRNVGRPFASWFWQVLRNRALDRMKYTRRRTHENLSESLEQFEGIVSPETLTDLRKILDRVGTILETLSPHCRLLLSSAAEGYTAKEMQVLLGLGPGDNKKLSDQLRYCRKKLVEELEQAGIQVAFDE